MPVEIMLLPRWFPFHLSKVSYWSRTVIAPLLVVMDRKPRAANPRGVSIRELFRDDPARETYTMNARGRPLGASLAGLDRVLRLRDRLRPTARHPQRPAQPPPHLPEGSHSRAVWLPACCSATTRRARPTT